MFGFGIRPSVPDEGAGAKGPSSSGSGGYICWCSSGVVVGWMFVAVCASPHTLSFYDAWDRCSTHFEKERKLASTHYLGYIGFYYCTVHRGTTTLNASFCIDCCRSPSIGIRLRRLGGCFLFWSSALCIQQVRVLHFDHCVFFEFRAILFDVPAGKTL